MPHSFYFSVSFSFRPKPTQRAAGAIGHLAARATRDTASERTSGRAKPNTSHLASDRTRLEAGSLVSLILPQFSSNSSRLVIKNELGCSGTAMFLLCSQFFFSLEEP